MREATLEQTNVMEAPEVQEFLKKGDLTALLQKHELEYVDQDSFVRVGPDPAQEDLVVHLSIIISQLEEAVDCILPVLKEYNLSFLLVKNTLLAKQLLEGSFGYEHIGKTVEIYIPVTQDYAAITNKLIYLTQPYKGPVVPQEFSIGTTLYIPASQIAHFSEYNPVNTTIPVDFKGKYKIVSVLGERAKGYIYQCLHYKGIFPTGFCLIKEGRKCMWSEATGRDITDRLAWQKELHTSLEKVIKIPKLFDFFEQNGNTYIVTEYVRGKDLRIVINEVFKGRPWQGLLWKEKNKLLDLLLQVLAMVQQLHQNGIVHRDLVPTNFLYTSIGELYLTDFELAYNISLVYPNPPFEGGTPGHASPEQIYNQQPTFKEDIYALGGTMLHFFLGLQPTKFAVEDITQLSNALNFFIGNKTISGLILAALDPIPEKRPSLALLQQSILAYKKELSKSIASIDDYPLLTAIDKNSIAKVIQSASHSLTLPQMKNDLELFGIRLHPDYRVSTKTRIYEKGLGLSSAVTGILFLLVSMNHKKELPVEVQEFYRERLAGFDPAAFLQEEAVSASIFNGTAGIAITTCLAWQLNWIDSDFNLDHLLQQCFKTKADTLDFSTGIAGQGIALLFSQKIKEINSARPLLSGYIDSLLNEQASNGSWPLLNTIDKKYDLRLISGIAGVLYLLLEYYQHRKDESVQKAIEKGLHWLSRKAKIRNHKYYWPIQHQGTKAYNQTLARGCGGIALLFLKAYQYLSHEKYRKIVEGTLSGISETPVWTEYGLSNGLAGLGVVYLEAATICKNRYWLTRAGWIATILVHSSSEQDKKCWNPGAGQEFDPSLLTGNTGIIYFLNRYKNQL